MDRRLLNYYNRELAHLRETGAEFAREFPKIAGRLALEEFTCADPYVERLLEGFAFLAARVQLKLDAEFPRGILDKPGHTRALLRVRAGPWRTARLILPSPAWLAAARDIFPQSKFGIAKRSQICTV